MGIYDYRRDDVCIVLRDNRGRHKHIDFYASCTDLELEAKDFVMQRASEKTQQINDGSHFGIQDEKNFN